MRGHFPAEVDVLVRAGADAGRPVDGIVVVPAMIEPGRLTVGSVHWMRTPDGMIPVSHSEFARDATFGYRNADLRDWVAEKTGGRIPVGPSRP
ncbi:four-carbon acid sugar kinase family protein [Pseudonocardia benzenivorans]